MACTGRTKIFYELYCKEIQDQTKSRFKYSKKCKVDCPLICQVQYFRTLTHLLLWTNLRLRMKGLLILEAQFLLMEAW